MFLEDMNLLLQILYFQMHQQWTVQTSTSPCGERLIGRRYLPYEIWQTGHHEKKGSYGQIVE